MKKGFLLPSNGTSSRETARSSNSNSTIRRRPDSTTRLPLQTSTKPKSKPKPKPKPSSSSWKKGFLNSTPTKPNSASRRASASGGDGGDGGGDNVRNKASHHHKGILLPQCTTRVNDGHSDEIGNPTFGINGTTTTTATTTTTTTTRQTNETKKTMTKRKKTSSALLSFEQVKPNGRSSGGGGILSIFDNADEDDDTIGRDDPAVVVVGGGGDDSNGIKDPSRRLILPLLDCTTTTTTTAAGGGENDKEKEDEVPLLREVGTTIRGRNFIGHDDSMEVGAFQTSIEYSPTTKSSLSSSSSSSLKPTTVDRTRSSPPFQLQEDKRPSTESSNVLGLGGGLHNNPLLSSKIENLIIDEAGHQGSSSNNGIEQKVTTTTTTATPTTTTTTASIKMELSFLLSKLKDESKRYRAATRRRKGGAHEHTEPTTNDTQLVVSHNIVLRSFVQKYLLPSERSPSSTSISTTTTTTPNGSVDVRSNLTIVWETILESIALHAKDNLPLRPPTSPPPTPPNNTLVVVQTKEAHIISSFPPVIRLGLSILQNCQQEGWITLATVALENGENKVAGGGGGDKSLGGGIQRGVDSATGGGGGDTKRRGLQILGAALVIKLHLCFSLERLSKNVGTDTANINNNDNDNNDDACAEINGFESLFVSMPCILQKILPVLIGVIDNRTGSTAGGGKCTLLSMTCMDSALLIIEYTAHAYRSSLTGNFTVPIIQAFPSLMWNTLPVIRRILDITQQWVKDEAVAPMSRRGCNNIDAKCGDDVVKYTDATRKQCALTILHDWKKVISDVEQIYHKCRSTDMQDEQMAKRTAVSSLCNEFAGAKICRDQNGETRYAPLILGGIAHTLCKGVPEFRTVSVNTLLEALGAASYFLEGRLHHSSPEDVYCDEETIILRAVCSWFARKRDFKWITSGTRSCPTTESKSATQNKSQKAVQLCITLLRSSSTRCSDFVLVILNRLWADNNGVPADMCEINQSQVQNVGVPVSFENLLQDFDLCQREGKNLMMLRPPQRVMCGLVERFILHKPDNLLPFFLSHEQTSNMSVHVTVSILEKCIVGKTDNYNILSDELCSLVINKLLGLIDSNNFLQKKLQDCPGILSSFPPNITVPRLVEIIGRQITSNYTTSVVSAVLGNILQKCPECYIYDAVFAIIKGAELSDGKGKEKSNFRSFTLAKYASIWRRTILQDQPHGLTRFPKLLCTIANVMFRMPSSSYPLSLFGAFIGNGKNIRDQPCSVEEQITIRDTTKAILELALPKINETSEEFSDELFPRLSPLLMLRRIPFAYFRLLHIDDDSDYALFTRLAKSIGLKLGIEKGGTLHVVNTPEEKRLLAEIAARCLPFSGFRVRDLLQREKLSCFERLCKPVFSRTLNSIHQDTVTRPDLEQSKFSLYTVCHFVQIAQDDDFADGLAATITFALQIVSLKNIREGTNHYDQIIELQTGCIDFFATCLQSYCNRVIIYRKEQPSKSCMIQEIFPTSNQSIKTISPSQQSISEKMVITCLEGLFPLLLEIICTAKLPKTSMKTWCLDLKASSVSPIEDGHFSFSSRTCLLNSFTLATQRCPIDNGSLKLLASLGLPPILQFASGAGTCKKLRHKLCIAASLQFTFNVLTRTKSFLCLKMQSLTINESVRQTYMLCADIIKTHTTDSEAYASGLLRTASLKLLLVITSIDQSGNGSNSDTSFNVRDCLAPGELAQIFSILRGAANIDTDRGVQALSAHILTALQDKEKINNSL